jgi:hypothetical protein
MPFQSSTLFSNMASSSWTAASWHLLSRSSALNGIRAAHPFIRAVSCDGTAARMANSSRSGGGRRSTGWPGTHVLTPATTATHFSDSAQTKWGRGGKRPANTAWSHPMTCTAGVGMANHVQTASVAAAPLWNTGVGGVAPHRKLMSACASSSPPKKSSSEALVSATLVLHACLHSMCGWSAQVGFGWAE